MTNHCPTCREPYESLGGHFRWNPDHRPPLDDVHREVLSFLALVGVAVEDRGDHPRLEVYSEGESFVRGVADGLTWLANEPRVHRTAEEALARFEERCGTVPNVDTVEWSDTWAVSTIPHPELDDYWDPSDVAVLTPWVARWLILAAGEWVGTVMGSLHIDVRGLAVDGDHVRTLLRDRGVTEFCDDTKTWQESHRHQGHWHDDVVALPHGWAMSLLDYAGLDVGDVPWTSDLFVTEEREAVTFSAPE